MLNYLRGADYGATAHAELALVPTHFVDWLAWMWREGALPAVALGAAGWAVAPGLRRRAVLLLLPAATGFGFTLTYGAYFPEIPDFSGYLAPALWLATIGAAGLYGRLSGRLPALAAAGLLAFTATAGARPIWSRDRSGLRMPVVLADVWLGGLPPNAVLIVESDHVFFPALYVQSIGGHRPDVVLINAGWAASSWYWRLLRRQHPDLAPISLAAPSTAARLRRLLMADPARPAFVENHRLAAQLGVRPCPATWGFALGPACARVRDDGRLFAIGLASWWSGPAARDPISRRVLAGLAAARAEGLWALGDAPRALRALQSGVPLDERPLPIPYPVEIPAGGHLSIDEPMLIGSPEHNRRLGAAALRQLGRDSLAAAWAP